MNMLPVSRYAITKAGRYDNWREPKNLGESVRIVRMMAPGKAQASRVRIASGGPPLRKPTTVSSCVELGPGSTWQKEWISISSSKLR
jgi:hypothetical protein